MEAFFRRPALDGANAAIGDAAVFVQPGVTVTALGFQIGDLPAFLGDFVDALEVIPEVFAHVTCHFVLAYRVGVWVIIHT